MELYLFRHGIAEDARPGGSDAARELTSEGRTKTAAIARLARKSGAKPSLIASSPLVRARQTARIAADKMDYAGEIVILDSLVPGGDPDRVWQDIRGFSTEVAVLLAGHEPLMSTLAAWLLNAPSLRVEMKKAALLRIGIESFRAGQPHGVLKWMITPRMTQG